MNSSAERRKAYLEAEHVTRLTSPVFGQTSTRRPMRRFSTRWLTRGVALLLVSSYALRIPTPGSSRPTAPHQRRRPHRFDPFSIAIASRVITPAQDGRTATRHARSRSRRPRCRTVEKVARKLRTREMPPAGVPRPDRDTYDRATSTARIGARRCRCASPNPGRVVVHRLNRTEYTNAIRDLLALDVDGDSLVPATNPISKGSTTWRACSPCRRVCSRTISPPRASSAGLRSDASRSGRSSTRSRSRRPWCRTNARATTCPLDRAAACRSLPVPARRRVQHQRQTQAPAVLYLMGMGEPHQIDFVSTAR
jgi:hypothetical protein